MNKTEAVLGFYQQEMCFIWKQNLKNCKELSVEQFKKHDMI